MTELRGVLHRPCFTHAHTLRGTTWHRPRRHIRYPSFYITLCACVRECVLGLERVVGMSVYIRGFLSFPSSLARSCSSQSNQPAISAWAQMHGEKHTRVGSERKRIYQLFYFFFSLSLGFVIVDSWSSRGYGKIFSVMHVSFIQMYLRVSAYFLSLMMIDI